VVESKSTGTEPAPPLPPVPMAVAPPPEEPLVSMDGTIIHVYDKFDHPYV
jgi:hypothetical protein